jgi:hypothetical protein
VSGSSVCPPPPAVPCSGLLCCAVLCLEAKWVVGRLCACRAVRVGATAQLLRSTGPSRVRNLCGMTIISLCTLGVIYSGAALHRAVLCCAAAAAATARPSP